MSFVAARWSNGIARPNGRPSEFHRRYAKNLPPRQRTVLTAYVGLETDGFLVRRLQLLKYGFLKTGPLRNLGWLLMI